MSREIPKPASIYRGGQHGFPRVPRKWFCPAARYLPESVPGYGPVTLMKRPVRIRMQGVVGAGKKPRLPD